MVIRLLAPTCVRADTRGGIARFAILEHHLYTIDSEVSSEVERMVVPMPTVDKLRPLEQRILAVIQGQGGEWVTREQVARLLGRPARIQPSDIAALDRLTMLGLLEAQEAPRGVAGVRWEYRVK